MLSNKEIFFRYLYTKITQSFIKKTDFYIYKPYTFSSTQNNSLNISLTAVILYRLKFKTFTLNY